MTIIWLFVGCSGSGLLSWFIAVLSPRFSADTLKYNIAEPLTVKLLLIILYINETLVQSPTDKYNIIDKSSFVFRSAQTLSAESN
jgi:hypothetical protein